MQYLPAELPAIRDRLVEYLTSTEGAFLHWSQDWPSGVEQELAGREALWFSEATLLHLAPSMVELLAEAKDGFGTAGFMDYDLPVMSGFAYFSMQLSVGTASGDQLRDLLEQFEPGQRPQITDQQWRVAELEWAESLAVLWHYEPSSSDHPQGLVVLSWYLERDAWWDWVHALYQIEGDSYNLSHFEDKIKHTLPPFIYDGHVVIECSPDAAGVTLDRYDRVTTPDHWRTRRTDMFRALCYLLRQRGIVTESVVTPDRATRRRAARTGREAAEVRVLALSGVGSGGQPGEGERSYAHRWVVRGHWRRQWYPSIQQHRPRWVAPFLKGPEGAPLLGGEKVYVTRPSSGVCLARDKDS